MDSVRDGITGRLVEYGDAAAFAAAAVDLLGDAQEYQRTAQRARDWARSFRWEDAALQTEEIVLRTLRESADA